MIGGLAVVGLFLGLYFGLGYPDAIESDAAHGFLRCEHGYDLINGKCTDINECIEDKENGLKLYKQTRKLGVFSFPGPIFGILIPIFGILIHFLKFKFPAYAMPRNS